MSNPTHKSIYEFTVYTEKDVPKTETSEVDGKTVSVTTTVKEKAATFFSFRKPSRAERDEADEYRVQEWTRLIKKGVMAEGLLSKEYSNNGGILSDTQLEHRMALKVHLIAKMEDHKRLVSENDSKGAIAALSDIVKIREEIIQAENEVNAFYENTAEARARNKLTEYLVVNFSYFRDAPDKEWEPFFKGNTLEARRDYLEQLNENKDALFLQAWERLLFVAALYISLSGNLTKEDIVAFEKDITSASPDSSGMTVIAD